MWFLEATRAIIWCDPHRDKTSLTELPSAFESAPSHTDGEGLQTTGSPPLWGASGWPSPGPDFLQSDPPPPCPPPSRGTCSCVPGLTDQTKSRAHGNQAEVNRKRENHHMTKEVQGQEVGSAAKAGAVI